MKRMIDEKAVKLAEALSETAVVENGDLILGKNLEVDGDLQVNGEIISGEPTSITSLLALTDITYNGQYFTGTSPYSLDQIYDLILKYRINGLHINNIIYPVISLNKFDQTQQSTQTIILMSLFYNNAEYYFKVEEVFDSDTQEFTLTITWK